MGKKTFSGFLLCTALLALNADARIEDILNTARDKAGTPYKYGAAGPAAFDCSGFVYYLLSGHVPGLPRGASAMGSSGQAVSREELTPGDIVLYATTGNPRLISHVALYIGNDSIIHAVSEGPNGVVQITSMNARYWKTRYHSARRLLGSSVYNTPQKPSSTAPAPRSPARNSPVKFAKGSYTGELKNGEPHGNGEYRFSNGDLYTGGFSTGNFHGAGLYVWKDGTRFQERFMRGIPQSPLPAGKKLYMYVEESHWETWDGNILGDYPNWKAQEEAEFEAYRKRDQKGTNSEG